MGLLKCTLCKCKETPGDSFGLGREDKGASVIAAKILPRLLPRSMPCHGTAHNPVLNYPTTDFLAALDDLQAADACAQPLDICIGRHSPPNGKVAASPAQVLQWWIMRSATIISV